MFGKHFADDLQRLIRILVTLFYLGGFESTFAQNGSVITSVSGDLNFIEYSIDHHGNVFGFLSVDYTDSLWINNKYYEQLKVKAKPRTSEPAYFLCKHNNKGELLNCLQFTGFGLSGFDIGTDNVGNVYFSLITGSDSLYINNDLRTDPNYKGAILLFKADSDLNILKLRLIKGNFAPVYKPKIIISKQSITLISSFQSGVITIDNDSLFHSAHKNYDAFICRFDLELAAIKYLIGMVGTGEDYISDAVVDSSEQIYFCGYSNSYSELKIGDKILDGSNLKGFSRLVIGKLNIIGKLEWTYQIIAAQNNYLSPIKLFGSNELYVGATIRSQNIEIGSNNYFNNSFNANGFMPLLLKLDSLGNLISSKDYNGFGQIEIRDFQLERNLKKFIYFVIRDSLSFNNEIYLQDNVIFEIGDTLDLLNPIFISSSTGSLILNTLSEKNENIYLIVNYSNNHRILETDTLFLNNNILDLNNISRQKVVLLSISNIQTNISEIKTKIENAYLFPNPTNGIVNISDKEIEYDSFDILDMKGNIIYRRDKLKSKIQSNNDLYLNQNGYYIINFYVKNKITLSKKILVFK